MVNPSYYSTWRLLNGDLKQNVDTEKNGEMVPKQQGKGETHTSRSLKLAETLFVYNLLKASPNLFVIVQLQHGCLMWL